MFETMDENISARPALFLGLESSCDDTAAAVVSCPPEGRVEIKSSIVMGQSNLHEAFGGVVPEIAARAHAERLDLCVANALEEAGCDLQDVTAIGVTAGPGLIGGVLSGVMCAKGLALGADKPLLGVNHLAGHALTPRLTDQIAFPYLMLLVSGGHCQFLIVSGPDQYHRLGGSIDDAPGEAFDKTARLIGLGQPGGPAIENAAVTGDCKRFSFPRPLLDRAGCDMSFSGLKTAVLRSRDALLAEQGGLYPQDQCDLSASFQTAVADVLAEKTKRALTDYLASAPTQPCLAVAGGVAANRQICAALQQLSAAMQVRFVAPPLALCTDNAAMISYAAAELYRLGRRDDMHLSARPRWPLDTQQPSLIGAGKKGPKA